MRSHLTAKRSKRSYNNLNRIRPGSVFLYNGKRYVVSGQISGGQYYRVVNDLKTNYPARNCILVQQNVGLTYL